MLPVALTLALGIAVLIAGADLLVRGAARLAAVLGVSALVIGLTVVAYGTSSPELAVSVASARDARPDIALGTVVGSNIFNVLVILGISAMIVPLAVAQKLVRLDVPLMLAISLLVAVVAQDGKVSRGDGGVLSAGAIAYTILAFRMGRRESAVVEVECRELEAALAGSPRRGARALALDGAMIGSGLVLLVLGARWLVDSAVAIARSLGVSELRDRPHRGGRRAPPCPRSPPRSSPPSAASGTSRWGTWWAATSSIWWRCWGSRRW